MSGSTEQSNSTATCDPLPTVTHTSRVTWSFVVVLLVALVARVAMVVLWQRQLGAEPFGFGDSTSYWDLARDLATGESYAYGWSEARCFRTPGYPLILAPLFWLYENPPVLAARAISVAFGIGLVALTYSVAQRFGGRAVATLAALGVALSPELVFSSALVLSETPFDFLLVLQLLIWLWYREARSPIGRAGHAVLLGSVTAFSILVRPSWLPAALVWGVALAFARRGRPRLNEGTVALVSDEAFELSVASRGQAIAVYALGLLLVLSPWWVRNARLYDTFVPTSLQTGASLWDGLQANATGASDMSEIDALRLRYVRERMTALLDESSRASWEARLPVSADSPDYWPTIKRELPPLWNELRTRDTSLPRFELAFDRYLGDLAKSQAADAPGRVASLGLEKFWRIWSPWPQEGLGRSTVARAVFALGFGVLLVGLLFRVAAILTDAGSIRHLDTWMLALPAVFFTLLHMIYVASIRYREPALPGLFIMAAVGIHYWQSRWAVNRSAKER
ncbi:MAG: glycosyltransferase family 39 protein [Planctomycetales bacterium]|nr:glycosyltransferase family 39 protein [Planctomycetales bacterium]